MGGGTEAFPDLGQHCEQEDFLPFECDSCQKVFCSEHRTQKSHNCPRADHTSRRVVVCELCSMSMEKASGEEERDILQRHERSGDCDPAKKRKPKCPVSRCKGLLTFSNSNTCKLCHLSVCLKHRFPSEHDCKATAAAVKGSKYLPYLPPRNCGNKKTRMPSPPSIKTY